MRHIRLFQHHLLYSIALLLLVGTVARAEKHVVVFTDDSPEIRDQAAMQNRVDQLKAKLPGYWEVTRYTLHGGKQEGVDLIEIHNGMLMIRVIPTRGMSIYDVLPMIQSSRSHRLAWDSPVKEIVHPQYINLESRGGLGWLEGFNEWMVRCGLEYAGHPGKDVFITNTGDQGEMDLTVHGKIGNIPASKVELIVDDVEKTLTLRGEVHERMFFGPKLELVTELTMTLESASFTIHDTVTNHGSGPQEMQLIYHTNFGAPLLEAGAKVHAAYDRVAPMNAHAASGIDDFQDYLGPTPGYLEQVYLLHPRFDAEGKSHVLLHNAKEDFGCSLTWNKEQLPYLTIWKNTTAVEDGYVTGLEPATGFPFNRRVERKFGRVPKLAAGESRKFDVTVNVHLDATSVSEMVKTIQVIQGDAAPTVDRQPPEIPK